MNTIVSTVGGNSLVALAADIRLHHEAIERAEQSKLELSIEIGKALNEAKELLKQTGGHWLKWLKLNFVFSHTTAAKYMKLAANDPQIETTGLNRSIRSVLKLIDSSSDIAEPPAHQKAPRPMSNSHKEALKAAHAGRIKAKRRNPNSAPIKQNFIPNIPGYLEEMLLTMERCVVDYEITPVDRVAAAIIAQRIKIEHFDEIIDWLSQLKKMVHQNQSAEG